MIHIMTTGGTIEGLDYLDNEGITKSNVSIKDFLERANINFKYIIENVFRKDSRSITKDDRELLVRKINQSNATKILVTHGTYTMEDTAKYLGKLNLNKTIVLVGSFILGSSNDTDAPFNLGYAISSLQLLKPNVYVAMNG
ncbi:MAG: asparaginase, partial [Winogradskyella sp.]